MSILPRTNQQGGPSYPKPDFSEMAPYLDILKYENADNVTDHNLYFWVRSKSNNLPSFCMQFLDRNGRMIDAYDTSCGTGIHMGYTAPQAGQKAKFDVRMPDPRNMPSVASVRVFRMK